MEIYSEQYYHLYNRSNNNEIVFKSEENFFFFLEKCRHYLQKDFDTLAYCLMPTHFHLLVLVKARDTEIAKKNFGILLSSYTKAINERYNRHGSLFQEHTKAKLIDNEQYLITALTYIHQNPVRAGLVRNLDEWPYSSFLDYIGVRNDAFLNMEIVRNYFPSIKDFKDFSNQMIQNIRGEYWV